jgi:copper transport protein
MIRRVAAAFTLAVLTVLAGASPAFAHTAFESSDPADGEVLRRPVERIRLVFTGEAEPVGEGFVVQDSTGELRQPDKVISEDNLTWELEFIPPLAEGATGVRWRVAAPDAHPIEGSLSFTVVTPDEGLEAGPSVSDDAAAGEDPEDREPGAALGEFLDLDIGGAVLVGPFGVVARTLSLLGAIVGIGGIVFAAVVLRGNERDVRSVLFWVRRAAVILGVGALLELVHRIAEINGSWWTVWPLTGVGDAIWAPFGLAVALRLGGAALMMQAHLDVVRASTAYDPVVAVQGLVGVGAGPKPGNHGPLARPGGLATGPYLYADDRAWRVDQGLTMVALGVLATLSSYAFDGHTVTEGARLVTAVVAVVHVAAAAIWAGGLLMLVHVVWSRYRRGVPVRALQLAVRFSVVAAGALVLAAIAGAVLTFIIMDSLSDLWSTSWGRVLLAKALVVAAAAAAGAYNHAVLIPEMLSRPVDDPDTTTSFRRAVTIEGAAMGVMTVLTAVLVAAAS